MGFGGWISGWFESDAVAERQLGEVVAKSAVDVDAASVVIAAEIMEAQMRIGQQIPDDDQDRAGDSDERFELAPALDDAPVALSEESVRPAATAAASPSTPLRYGFPLPVFPPRCTGPDWMVRGHRFAHDTR